SSRSMVLQGPVDVCLQSLAERLEVLAEVSRQHFAMRLRMSRQHIANGRPEGVVAKDRAERDVQDLPAVVLVEIELLELRVVADGGLRGDHVEPRGNVIRGAVALEPLAREVDDATEELSLVPRRNAERFQVAGAGRLHVEQA